MYCEKQLSMLQARIIPKPQTGVNPLMLFLLGIILFVIGSCGIAWGGILLKASYIGRGGTIPMPWKALASAVGIIVLANAFVISGGLLAKDGYDKLATAVRNSFCLTVHAILAGTPMVFLSGSYELIPLSVGIFVDITNISPYVNRITGYQVNIYINRISDRGDIVGGWHHLRNVGIIDNNIYAVWNGLDKARQLMCGDIDFVKQAGTVQLTPGGVISGWLFFEYEKDIYFKENNDILIEMILKDGAGKMQHLTNIHPKIPDNEEKLTTLGDAYFKIGPVVDLSGYKIRARVPEE
ncbi:MAG: hypothetical protein ABSF52_03360 [Syntrophobacteraceae bacterium]